MIHRLPPLAIRWSAAMLHDQERDIFPHDKAPVWDETKRGDATVFKQALEKYHGEFSDETLAFEDDRVLLYYKSSPQVVSARQYWQTLTKFVSSGMKPPVDPMEGIVKLITSPLLTTSDPNVSVTEDGSFFWTVVDIQMLSGNIRKPQQLPVILYTGSQFSESDATEVRLLVEKITPVRRQALVLVAPAKCSSGLRSPMKRMSFGNCG